LQQAAEAKRERELKSIKFSQGKKAYSTGQYDACMLLFQDALEQEGDLSPLGGEIQLWLALAYQVNPAAMILPVTCVTESGSEVTTCSSSPMLFPRDIFNRVTATRWPNDLTSW
jgi:hypothetical protein